MLDYEVMGDTCLQYAVERKDVDAVMRVLMQGNCSTEEVTDELPNASYAGCLDIVKVLLEYGADVHAFDELALQWASEKNRIEVVKLLLEHGADPQSRNNTAIKWANRAKHVEVVRILEEHILNTSRKKKIGILTW